MVALTVHGVQRLQTKTHIKTKLAFIIGIGGISGIMGFVKIGIVYGTPNDYGRKWYYILIIEQLLVLTESVV